MRNGWINCVLQRIVSLGVAAQKEFGDKKTAWEEEEEEDEVDNEEEGKKPVFVLDQFQFRIVLKACRKVETV